MAESFAAINECLHNVKKKLVTTWPVALTTALLKCFKHPFLEDKIISDYGSETPSGWAVLTLTILQNQMSMSNHQKPAQNRYHPGNLLFWLHPSGSTSVHLKREASCLASVTDSRLCESHSAPPPLSQFTDGTGWIHSMCKDGYTAKVLVADWPLCLRLLRDTTLPSDVRLIAKILREFRKSIWWVIKTSAMGGIQMLNRTGPSAWLKQGVSEQSSDKQRGRKWGINIAERNKRWWQSQQGVSLWLCRIKRITRGEMYVQCSCEGYRYLVISHNTEPDLQWPALEMKAGQCCLEKRKKFKKRTWPCQTADPWGGKFASPKWIFRQHK